MTSQTTPKVPPLDGSISILPGFVDFHAEHNADHPWVLFPAASGTATSISFRELARATHRIAHALRPNREGQEGEVVAVFIHCDTILYIALIIGMVRAGLVPFPMSPRNSAVAVVDMLQQTSCHRIVTQSTLFPLVETVNAELKANRYSLHIDQLPDLFDIFPTIRTGTNSPLFKAYPSRKESPSRDDVVLYLHSSGSTGFPKAIPQTHITILDWCRVPAMTTNRENGIVWAPMALPTFHTMGVYTQIYSPLVSGYPIGLYAPQAPAPPVVPTPRNVLEVAKIAGCTGIMMVPAFLEIWAQSDEDIRFLSSLKMLQFAGGPLSKKSGNKLVNAGVNLGSVYGATEFGVPCEAAGVEVSQKSSMTSRSKEDWAWISFYTALKYRMVPEGDGAYELHILTSDVHHPSVENLDDTRGYATKDLFEPHPSKTGLWRITGRKDDVLVLASGEKIVPIPQEGHIISSPLVAGAVMFGRGKSQAGILIEPHLDYAKDPKDEAVVIEFRNKIWPAVEEANDMVPTFARIFKELILVTDPEKPLPRAAKSTVIRKQALALYAEEIENLYRAVANSADTRGIAPPCSWETPDIEHWLVHLAADIKGDPSIYPNVDVFDQGFDSLHATFLRNRIISTLRTAQDPTAQQAAPNISQNFVFDHPTLHELAAAISAAVNSNNVVMKDVANDITELLERYSSDLPTYVPKTARFSRNLVVLLTGSTGNVGSHILAALLSDPRIVTVYTINRATSTSGEARQAQAFEERGLPTTLLRDTRLVQLTGDVSLDYFNLPTRTYDEICQTVTHVVHNAWKVDFNHSLRSFEPLIAGTRKLIDACYTFSQPVRLLYTSSIAVSLGWNPSQGVVPEEPLPDPNVAVATGYGASKYIVEKLLAEVATRGMSTTTLRIGQVCGSEKTGAWSTREWVAVLVKSSVSLGVMPDLTGSVSWIPIDAVASAVTDLIVSQEQLPGLVNVVHPQRTTWREVLMNINKHIGQEPLAFVDFNEWVKKLESLSETVSAEDLDRVPAIKLLDFFRGLSQGSQARLASDTVEAGGTASFSTVKLRAFSSTIRDLAPLNEEHAKNWVQYWKNKRYL